ncbi:MAG: gliding motility-associated C-terminal domain-containing protein [Crocinitomicaceae bacterium]|nr:gliding motility-associated C-terminal domain-containing protein [Crocinitomicaceae bacterium]
MRTLKYLLITALCVLSVESYAKVILVKDLGDSGQGTLRGAFQVANSGDTVLIDVKGTIELITPIAVDGLSNVRLMGPHAAHCSIVASASWGSGVSLFNITNSSGFSIENVGFVNGTPGVRAINVFSSAGNAGAPVRIVHCLFDGIDNSGLVAGAIETQGLNVEILNCSFVQNKADSGGAIHVAGSGQTLIQNCTFWGNNATNNGGAIYVQGNTTVTVMNNTFYENTSSNGLGQVLFSDNGPTVNLQNNAGAGNGVGEQLMEPTCCSFISNGGNIFKQNTGSDFGGWTTAGDQYHTGVVPGLRNTVLVDGFGMKYFTIVNSGSTFIDQGNPSGIAATDLRGAPRILFGGITTGRPDAGACEFTQLRVVNNGGGVLVGSLGAALSLSFDPINYVEFDIPGGPPLAITPTAGYVLTSDYIVDGFSQQGSVVPGPAAPLTAGVTPGEPAININNVTTLTTGVSIVGGVNGSIVQGLRITGFDNNGIAISMSNCKVFGCDIGFDAVLAAVPNGQNGIFISNDGNQVGGGEHWQRNVISGNGVNNITLSASGNLIYGNFIGIAPDGMNNLTSAVSTNIGILDESTVNVIGGTKYLEGNVIGNHNSAGIRLDAASSGVIQHNKIGVMYDGTQLAPNAYGIELGNNSGGIQIGGSSGPKTRNIISGNNTANIWFYGANNTVVQGNFIGLDSSGTIGVASTPDGIWFNSNINANNQIGGVSAAEANIVSGNQEGIRVQLTTGLTTIIGNYIGTDYAGTAAVGNSNNGIRIESSAATCVIGSAGAGNVISGNNSTGGAGILLNNASSHIVQGNWIGLDATGLDTLGNYVGIYLEACGTITIGGDIATGEGNIISGNLTEGIFISSSSSTTVYGNMIGTDVNGTAPLGNLNNGVLVVNGADTEIGGTATNSGNQICAHSGVGSAGIRLEGSGLGTKITTNRIGTTLNGMSPLPNETGIVVTNTHQVQIGGLSPLENYICASTVSGINVTSSNTVIDGNFIGVGVNNSLAGMGNLDGIYIEAASVMVGSSNTAYLNIIANNLEDGIEINTDLADNCMIDNCRIGVDGAGNAAGNAVYGIHITDADATQIGVLTPNHIVGSGTAGINVFGTADNTFIRQNYIGEISGSAAFQNGNGIELLNGPTGTQIGDVNLATGNTIINCVNDGIRMNSVTNTTILGNRIGLDSSDNAGPNNIGISALNSSSNSIGGSNSSSSAYNNIISNNTLEGIILDASNDNTIFGNFIGMSSDGLNPAGNATGIRLTNGADANLIGASSGNPNFRNVISGNSGSGIIIENSDTNQVKFNFIGPNNAGSPLNVQPIGVQVTMGASENEIGGDFDQAGNVIAGNVQTGVIIDNASNNSVLGNTVGLGSNQLNGVQLSGATCVNNTIGEVPPGTFGNVIMDNASYGVQISTGANNNVISANYIGINKATNMATAPAVQAVGVRFEADAGTDNYVGNDVSAGGNIISGNGTGIEIFGASNQFVYNNYIGTDTSGMTAVPNAIDGIMIRNGGSANAIGGSNPHQGNVISGNIIGVSIIEAGSSNNQVLGNTIGLNVAETASIPNTVGVRIDAGAQFNYVGLAGAGNENLISGNQTGVAILNTSNNNVQNNEIGPIVGNSFGIVIDGGSSHTIGGTAGEGNIISGNDSTGVVIISSTSNNLSSNNIGILADGQTPLGNLIGIYLNQATNNYIGNPALNEQNVISGNTWLGIGLENNSNGNFIRNNFLGTGASGNQVFGGTSNGVGIMIVGSDNNYIGGDWLAEEGNVICFSSDVGIRLDGATNTTISGNNIGLSKDNDSYLGNTMEGIYLENNSNGNTIGVSGNGFENVITDNNTTGIYIEGSSNNTIQNNFIGNDHLGGQGSVTNGVNDQQNGIALGPGASNNTVTGLNVISGNTNAGLGILGVGAESNTVAGNFFGVDLSGNVSYPNGIVNVYIGDSAKFNLIGGNTPSQKNIIGGDVPNMVIITDAGTDSNQVAGNFIGLGIDESTTYNSNFGVIIQTNAKKNVIGGGLPGEGNSITDFSFSGILIAAAQQNSILGNRIGIKPDGSPAPIDSAGVSLKGGDNTWIGAFLPGSDSMNVITNCNSGVEIATFGIANNTYGSVVGGNSIYNNTNQGIDINGDHTVLPIDTANNNVFANNGEIDRCEIISAWNCGSSGNTHIGFKFYASNMIAGYHIEVYKNPNPDPSGYGEGEIYLGDYIFNPGSPYDTIAIDLGQVLPVGTVITATITGVLGNTSEFSLQDTVTNPPVFNLPTTIDETCLGANDGQIEIIAPEAYYFSIDGFLTSTYGNEGDTLTGLLPGGYTVGAMYLNGCVLTQNVTLQAGPPLPFDYEVFPDTCGMGVGAVVFDTIPTNGAGGTGAYEYSYDSGTNYGGSISLGGLFADTLGLVLTDTTLGCYSSIVNVEITEVNDVVDETFYFSDFCPGNTAVYDSVATTGGWWDLGPGAGTATIDSLTGVLSNTTVGNSYDVIYTVGVCEEKDTITVTAANFDDPSFTYPDFCFGTTPTITTVTPGGTWSLTLGNGVIDTASGAIVGMPGQYGVVYTTQGTCAGIDTNYVQMLAQPNAPVINATQTIYCLDDTLEPLSTNADVNLTYEWYTDPALTNPVATGTTFTPLSIATGDNYIYLTSTDTNGCKSQADSVNYLSPDLSGMYAGPDMFVCMGSTIILEAFGGNSYYWEYSEQLVDDQTLSNPSAYINASEEFIVIITDVNGCAVTDTLDVVLLPQDSCYVETYNAFSPNNDGTNDIWIIDGIEGFPENQVYIYNRWGDKLKTLINYDNSTVFWDGTNNGNKPVPAGTYFYVVEVGGTRNQAGWVQVMK